jgi:hypothetical protein
VLQEDTTWDVNPDSPPAIADQLALNFHKSHHPIARHESTDQGVQGHEDAATATITDVAPGRYYLSVLPYSGHAMAGIPVDWRSGEATVTVTTEAHPIPTAQIAVYLFEDCYPLNGAPDLPEEELASVNGDGTTNNSCTEADSHPGPDFTKFMVVIEEPAGKVRRQRRAAVAGRVRQSAGDELYRRRDW